MPGATGGIATRQSSASLFQSVKPLAAGGSVTSRPFLVDGLSKVVFSVLADQAFNLIVEEGNQAAGPWTVVYSGSSQAVGLNQRSAAKIEPVGAFMRVTVANLGGPQELFSAAVFGIPI